MNGKKSESAMKPMIVAFMQEMPVLRWRLIGFTDKQWQRLAGDDLSLKAPARIVSETKSRVSASKPRPKMVKIKKMSDS